MMGVEPTSPAWKAGVIAVIRHPQKTATSWAYSIQNRKLSQDLFATLSAKNILLSPLYLVLDDDSRICFFSINFCSFLCLFFMSY